MTNISAKALLTVILVYFVGIFTGANGKITYEAEFSEDLKSCKDFQNKNIKCEGLKIGIVDGNEDEYRNLGLSGDLEIGQSLEEGYSMSIDVWKFLDVGKEFFFTSLGDICECLKNEKAPWYPLVLNMNVSGCPIPAKIYSISDFLVSLEFAKDLMTPEMCGEYEIFLSILDDKEEKLLCYVLGVSIAEVETND